MPIVLVIQSDDGQKRVKLGSNPILLGRSSSCHVKLKDGQVSGKHLSINIGRDGKTLVKDLETTNGTYLNGSKIMECHLFLDDEITMGAITISLDGEEMGPKEKAIHTRAGEKTQHTFINLPIDETIAISKAMQKVKTSQETQQEKPKPKPSFKNEDARQKEIAALLKADEVASKEEEEKIGVKTRVINKAKEKSKEDGRRDAGEVRQGQNFDLEESSGETAMIKIDRPKKGKKK